MVNAGSMSSSGVLSVPVVVIRDTASAAWLFTFAWPPTSKCSSSRTSRSLVSLSVVPVGPMVNVIRHDPTIWWLMRLSSVVKLLERPKWRQSIFWGLYHNYFAYRQCSWPFSYGLFRLFGSSFTNMPSICSLHTLVSSFIWPFRTCKEMTGDIILYSCNWARGSYQSIITSISADIRIEFSIIGTAISVKPGTKRK